MKPTESPPGPLHALKNFQRRTVERAMQRLYLDSDHGTRFLVADEVGLGKTMVARGLIAEAIAHLQREGNVRRIDVVYICSNAAIARQNLNRLSIDRSANFVQANRLTMLANSLHELSEDRPNFVSFTPGTSFELKSSGGRFEERLILLRILSRKKLNLSLGGLRRMLRGGVKPQRWRDLIRKHARDKTDVTLRRQFLKELRADKALYRELREVALEFDSVRGRPAGDLKGRRNSIVGRLRTVLAKTCVHALEPDLVILDEFQRFKHLLRSDSDDEAVQLANLLMTQSDAASGQRTRVVLLSATPYSLLTLDHEKEENHYADFLKTLRFLFAENSEQVPAIQTGLQTFRRALLDGDLTRAGQASRDVSVRLRMVMSRTERVSVSRDRDAMLTEMPMPAPLHVDDLLEAAVVDRISHAIGAPEPVEYWKSSPYLISTLKGYELKKRLQRGHRMTDTKVREALTAAARYGLRRTDLERYAPIDPRNGRLRVLLAETVGRGQAELPWIAPSLAYWRPQGAWSRCTAPTKSLVFSAWNVAPDCIAALCSYEAERAALAGADGVSYFDLHDQRKPLLTFKTTGDQIAGTVHLALLYPSPTLATAVDPLRISLEEGSGEPAGPDSIRRRAEQTIARLLRTTGQWPTSGSERVDQRWYWAAPALLDKAAHPEVREWCTSRNGWRMAGLAADGDEDRGSGFESALARFLTIEEDGPLGRAPEDLVEVLAELALAAPGVVALRSLLRLFGGLPGPSNARHQAIDPALLQAAATMAEGMRSLFNHPEAIGLLLREELGDMPYWRRTLRTGIDGNLQATFDEYVHTLKESLGLFDRSAAEAATDIAATVREAASIRSSRVVIDEIDPSQPPARMFNPMNVRSRFALRFGQMKDDKDKTVARIGTVREAFNSPFRPFVLATTSIGQEGLDFHTYCHAIYHWNLPSNPVDLEQREGRIQRYKGHAVRRNVALRFGLAALNTGGFDGGDPWHRLFELAAAESATSDSTELRPYWIFETEGGARIERRVPVLPFSREVSQLARLKRELTLYRLAFGQPRQEDLLHLLSEVQVSPAELAQFQIDLRP